MTKRQLIKAAREEIDEWRGLPRGLVMAILFCFVHRATEGETFEETFTFMRPTSEPIDYQI